MNGRVMKDLVRPFLPAAVRARLAFSSQAKEIIERHDAQTIETVQALNRKYAAPLIGTVRVWDLLEMLAGCVDPTDPSLYGASKLIHVLQVVQAMEDDRVTDPDMLCAALVHDLGKLLLLHGEMPENVACMNAPIGEYPAGVGLDNCVFQWNHDEFAYSRLKDHVPEHVAWLVRYHSIMLSKCKPLMDERDLDWTRRFLLPFQKYDLKSKSPYAVPRKTLADYKELVEELFPQPILF
jgi:hypothetical protein